MDQIKKLLADIVKLIEAERAVTRREVLELSSYQEDEHYQAKLSQIKDALAKL